MTKQKFYIKERHNPQIGVYYVCLGQISNKKAKAILKSKDYGVDYYLLAYKTETEYKNKIEELKMLGKWIHINGT